MYEKIKNISQEHSYLDVTRRSVVEAAKILFQLTDSCDNKTVSQPDKMYGYRGSSFA